MSLINQDTILEVENLVKYFTLEKKFSNKNSEIIIFDEATSALDKETSDNILRDILSLKNIKTIIFATHQINMLKDFDRIYEIKDKKLICIK